MQSRMKDPGEQRVWFTLSSFGAETNRWTVSRRVTPPRICIAPGWRRMGWCGWEFRTQIPDDSGNANQEPQLTVMWEGRAAPQRRVRSWQERAMYRKHTFPVLISNASHQQCRPLEGLENSEGKINGQDRITLRPHNKGAWDGRLICRDLLYDSRRGS